METQRYLQEIFTMRIRRVSYTMLFFAFIRIFYSTCHDLMLDDTIRYAPRYTLIKIIPAITEFRKENDKTDSLDQFYFRFLQRHSVFALHN